MATYEITAEMNLKKVIAESREVAQALNEFADNLERNEMKYTEPKTGHWIKTLKEDITECMAGSGYVFMCSECKKWENHPKSFCPNCSAAMFNPQ